MIHFEFVHHFCIAPQVSVLKHEKEMLLNAEKRACDEVRSLSGRVHRLQVLYIHTFIFYNTWLVPGWICDKVLIVFSFACLYPFIQASLDTIQSAEEVREVATWLYYNFAYFSL